MSAVASSLATRVPSQLSGGAVPHEARAEIDDRSLRRAFSTSRIIGVLPFAVIPLAIAVAPHVSALRVTVWVVVLTLSSAMLVAVGQRGMRCIDAGRSPGGHLAAAQIALLVIALAMGLLHVWVPLPDGRTDLALMYQLWITGCAAAVTLVVGSATRMFTVIQVPMLLTNAVLVLAGFTEVPIVVGISALAFLAVLVGCHVDFVLMTRRSMQTELEAVRLAAELSIERDRAAERATHDGLTGLANRELFRRHLDAALTALGVPAVGERERRATEVAVMFVDLDRFKVVNDSLGHHVGDQLLVAASRRIRNVLPHDAVLSRHGGDEFTVLIPAVADRSAVTDIAERIRTALTSPFAIDGHPLEISTSIGVAFGRASDDGDDLLRHADAGLYRAKDAGRDAVQVFDDAMRDGLRRRLSEEQEVRRALAAGDVKAWFQPVVEIETQRIVALEALARWHHPDRGVLSPFAFLPTIIECGLDIELVGAIGFYAGEFVAQIDDIVDPSLRVSLNVLGRRGALDRIVDLHQQADDFLPMRRVCLEITEQAVLHDIEAGRKALLRARELGMHVSLDDFGTGYSSLSLVRELPLDQLKIDRSFVAGMGDRIADRAIVEVCAQLANRLRLETVAEGIETAADAARIHKLGIRLGQGYHWHRPMPADEAIALLRAQAAEPTTVDSADAA
jgi:diguanylate cyclase (GGDEF)-like protein